MKKQIHHFFKNYPIRIYLVLVFFLFASVANAQSLNWAFLKGFNELQGTPVYGTMGVADSANLPGARHSSATWKIGSKLYLFGGASTTSLSGFMNDLWEFDTDTGNWKWINGSSLSGQAATYGTMGQSAEANNPGGRGSSVTWVSGGKLYLFGGMIYNSGNSFRLNDLWVFDPATGYWTWIKGSSTTNPNGFYGTFGVAAEANTPGARYNSVSWVSGDKLYLFGGISLISGQSRDMNDLWVFGPATGYWTWIKGSSLGDQAGTYGTLGVAASVNTPGARNSSVSWEKEGKLYLFGGTNGASLNDFWEYEVETGHWRWIKGSNTTNQAGIYGTRGLAAADNMPGARYGSVSCLRGGKLFLFGGFGRGTGNSGLLNDLWEYDPDTGHWRWVKGSSSTSQKGTLGAVPAANQPGARQSSVGWENGVKLYLFGGRGFGITERNTLRGDLWAATFVSTAAALTDLAISDGTLSPDFDSNTTNYSASVNNSTTSITVTPTVSDSTATVTVNGISVTSGTASQAISLSGGTNTITTVVTAQDEETTKTYTITVNRALSTNANLAALALSSGAFDREFDAATLSYRASVPYATTTLTVTPTLAESNAAVQVQVNSGGYASVTSATASSALGLNLGSNTIDVKVTAQDGTTIKTYSITVTREKVNQTITFNALSAKKYGDVAFELAATGEASGNAITYVSSNTAVAAISGTKVTILGAGSTNITASQAGNTNYTSATDVVQTLTVNKANQTISFPALANKTFGDAAFDLAAMGGASGNAVTYVSSNTAVATISGRTVTIVGAGSTIITASQAGTANYLDAADVQQVLIVNSGVSAIANLSALGLSAGTLSPVFASTTTSYSVSVANSVSSITISPAAEQADATIRVNGSLVKSASTSASIALMLVVISSILLLRLRTGLQPKPTPSP